MGQPIILLLIVAGMGFSQTDQYQQATFAGGCFWCMEKPFDAIDGVIDTTSGYTGGTTENPTYEQVSKGGTGHAEAVQVRFDPSKVTYEQLLEVFWKNIDPTVENKQFCDTGSQYRSGIYYQNPTQKAAAEKSREAIQKAYQLPHIYTEIKQFTGFYRAEDYHQNYYQKNPIRYKYYRYACGRDQRLEEVWGKKPHQEGKK